MQICFRSLSFHPKQLFQKSCLSSRSLIFSFPIAVLQTSVLLPCCCWTEGTWPGQPDNAHSPCENSLLRLWSGAFPVHSYFHRYTMDRTHSNWSLCDSCWLIREFPRVTIQNNQDTRRIVNNTLDQQQNQRQSFTGVCTLLSPLWMSFVDISLVVTLFLWSVVFPSTTVQRQFLLHLLYTILYYTKSKLEEPD